VRELVTTALEILGMGSATFGVFLIWVPAGFIAAGVCLVVLGYLLARS
jgi:hypothetical protein